MASSSKPSEGVGGGESAPIPNFEALIETLNFDPFGPVSKEGSEGGEGGQDTTAGGEQTPAAVIEPGQEGAVSPPPPPPPPPPGDPAPEADPKDKAITDLQAMVAQLVAKQVEPTEKTSEKPAEAPKGPEAPKYAFSVPSEVTDMIVSEEPKDRVTGVNALVNAIMNKLATDFGQALSNLETRIRTEVPSQVTQITNAAQVKRAIYDDLYGNFPEIKTLIEKMPAMEDMIWGQAVNLARAQKLESWTPEFRNQFGTYVRTTFGLQPAKANGGAPTPPLKPRAPFAAGSGTSGRAGSDETSQQYLDVLTADA